MIVSIGLETAFPNRARCGGVSHALIPADKICDFVGSFLRVDELCSSWWCFFGGKATEKTDWIEIESVSIA